METILLTSLGKEEFKHFLKEALSDIIGEGFTQAKNNIPDILDVKQAAEFLRLKVTTLYEKTSEKTIPHFKKGNKLYFKREELEHWVQEGKVSTHEELQEQAASYTLNRRKK